MFKPIQIHVVDDAINDIVLLDQRALPEKEVYVTVTTYEGAAEAIKVMIVRGAPLIGAVAACGLAMCLNGDFTSEVSPSAVVEHVKKAKKVLDSSRPTAVNLVWATDRMLSALTAKVHEEEGNSHSNSKAKEVPRTRTQTLDEYRKVLTRAAQDIFQEDIASGYRMEREGVKLLQAKHFLGDRTLRVITHCNTGPLATCGVGTALGVVMKAHLATDVEAMNTLDGSRPIGSVFVWVDETRPRMQGSRLTALELSRLNVPHRVVVDGASGLLMLQNKVDVVLFGADRIARNGDTANKIGTYNLSVVAKENGVPVYCVAPVSTIDLGVECGSLIQIEEREEEEVLCLPTASSEGARPTRVSAPGSRAFNPAFDVTPSRYITAFITDEGVCYPPFEQSLRRAKEAGAARTESRANGRRPEVASSSSSSSSTDGVAVNSSSSSTKRSSEQASVPMPLSGKARRFVSYDGDDGEAGSTTTTTRTAP